MRLDAQGGQTPLHLAFSARSPLIKEDACRRVAELLLDEYADVHAEDEVRKVT